MKATLLIILSTIMYSLMIANTYANTETLQFINTDNKNLKFDSIKDAEIHTPVGGATDTFSYGTNFVKVTDENSKNKALGDEIITKYGKNHILLPLKNAYFYISGGLIFSYDGNEYIINDSAILMWANFMRNYFSIASKNCNQMADSENAFKYKLICNAQSLSGNDNIRIKFNITNKADYGTEYSMSVVNPINVNFLLNNGSYVKFNVADDKVTSSEPIKIDGQLKNYVGNIAASVTLDNGITYFFLHNSEYIIYDTKLNKIETIKDSINDSSWAVIKKYTDINKTTITTIVNNGDTLDFFFSNGKMVTNDLKNGGFIGKDKLIVDKYTGIGVFLLKIKFAINLGAGTIYFFGNDGYYMKYKQNSAGEWYAEGTNPISVWSGLDKYSDFSSPNGILTAY